METKNDAKMTIRVTFCAMLYVMLYQAMMAMMKITKANLETNANTTLKFNECCI